jgi:hypothetical protein
MKAELKNVKINKQLSEETTCFSATLYVEGKKTAIITNRGCGGEDEIPQIFDNPLFDEFENWVKTQPPLDSDYGNPLPMDLGLYVGCVLLPEWEKSSQLKKWSKKETIFRIKGDKEDSYRTLKKPYSEEMRAFIEKKYGNQVEVIYNQQGVAV